MHIRPSAFCSESQINHHPESEGDARSRTECWGAAAERPGAGWRLASSQDTLVALTHQKEKEGCIALSRRASGQCRTQGSRAAAVAWGASGGEGAVPAQALVLPGLKRAEVEQGAGLLPTSTQGLTRPTAAPLISSDCGPGTRHTGTGVLQAQGTRSLAQLHSLPDTPSPHTAEIRPGTASGTVDPSCPRE